MSLRRYAAKRDSNEREIIDALVAAGASVQQLSLKGAPDLLVGFRGETYLMEVKTAKGKLTPDEQDWLNAWQGQATVVRTIEDAFVVIGAL